MLCEEQVPLEAAKRKYVLIPDQGAACSERPSGASGMGIGMDDPRLADRLKKTALDAPPDTTPTPLTYRIAGEAPAWDGVTPHKPQEQSEPAPKEKTTGPAPDAEDSSPVEALLEADRADRVEQVLQEERPRAFRELLVAMLLTALGVATAYYLAREQGMNPTLHMATGGTLGLLMGWICIRWMRPRR
jgi:hypothetical protein